MTTTLSSAAKQEKIKSLVAGCLRKFPSMGEILLYIKLVAKEDAPEFIARTDGTSIEFGNAFFDYPLRQQAFILLHEVLHVAFRHAKRLKNIIQADDDAIHPHLTWNLACDAVINECLELICDGHEIQCPDDAILLSTLQNSYSDLPFNKKEEHEWSSDEIYIELRKVINQQVLQLQQQGGGKGKGNKNKPAQSGGSGAGNLEEKAKKWEDLTRQDLGNGQPDYVEADGIPAGETDEVNAQIWSERLERAVKGTGNARLIKRMSGEFPQIKTPWTRILKDFLNKQLLPERKVSWRSPSRRTLAGTINFVEPARTKKTGIQRVALLLDVSGSCWDTEVFKEFIANVQAIQAVTCCEIVLIPFECGHIEPEQIHIIKSDGRTLTQKLTSGEVVIRGGGGTSFVEPLNKAAEYSPQVTVALTDGYGDFPEKCPVPPSTLLWAMNSNEVAPYGRTLKIEKL